MTLFRADAIVCAARGHGEHGVIVRLLTRDAGLVGGYVRGGRSRAMRPVLIPGNLVVAELRARTTAQLAGATVDLLTSRAPLLAEPLAASAVEWLTTLTAACLPEDQPFPMLYDALAATLEAVAVSPGARGWAAALARYELLLLSELGFGLDLDQCAATGARDDLTHVSPKSGGAVCAGAAHGYEARLFPLPPFLRGQGSAADLAERLAALAITGHFVERALFEGKRGALLDGRRRLIDRLQRAVA